LKAVQQQKKKLPYALLQRRILFSVVVKVFIGQPYRRFAFYAFTNKLAAVDLWLTLAVCLLFAVLIRKFE